MADHQNVKIYLITTKTGTRGLSRSLITNLYSTFWNSKWWNQYGGSKCQHLLYLDENWCSGVVEVADDELSLKILKFKMPDLLWRVNMQASQHFIDTTIHVDYFVQLTFSLSSELFRFFSQPPKTAEKV